MKSQTDLDKKYKDKLKWFQDRIGKRIYRDDVSCDCEVCTDIEHNGLIIFDDTHAHYLNDCSFEMSINYRDKK